LPLAVKVLFFLRARGERVAPDFGRICFRVNFPRGFFFFCVFFFLPTLPQFSSAEGLTADRPRLPQFNASLSAEPVSKTTFCIPQVSSRTTSRLNIRAIELETFHSSSISGAILPLFLPFCRCDLPPFPSLTHSTVSVSAETEETLRPMRPYPWSPLQTYHPSAHGPADFPAPMLSRLYPPSVLLELVIFLVSRPSAFLLTISDPFADSDEGLSDFPTFPFFR